VAGIVQEQPRLGVDALEQGRHAVELRPRALGEAVEDEVKSVALPRAGRGGRRRARPAGLKVHRSALETLVAWARSAPSAEEPATLHHRLFLELDADQLAEARSIDAIESELAGLLARTPYVLPLSIVGIDVVSAAESAGEMGPIERYPKARVLMLRCF